MDLLLLLIFLALGAFGGWLAGITSRSGGITAVGNMLFGMAAGVGVGALAVRSNTNAFMTPFLVLFVVFVGGMLLFAAFGMLRKTRSGETDRLR